MEGTLSAAHVEAGIHNGRSKNSGIIKRRARRDRNVEALLMIIHITDSTGEEMQITKLWPGWDIVRTLWKDDYGTVYEICKSEDGHFIRSALRAVFIPDGSTMRESLRKIEDRLAVLAELQGNSHIVSYEDHRIAYPEDASGCYVLIRMELSESLESRLWNHPMNEEAVLKAGTDICDALIRCSQMQIICDPIDPGNIFVNKFGDYKLGGLERVRINKSEGTGGNFGKNCLFCAPEVVRGEACDVCAEIYSLAMALYYLLNDFRLPYAEKGTADQPEKNPAAAVPGSRAGMPEPRHGSPAIKAVVMKALSYDPEARYQSAEEFRRALESCRTADTKRSLNADSAGLRHGRGMQLSIMAGLAFVIIAVLFMGTFTLLSGRSDENPDTSHVDSTGTAAGPDQMQNNEDVSAANTEADVHDGKNGNSTGGERASSAEKPVDGSNAASPENSADGTGSSPAEDIGSEEESAADKGKAGTVQPIENAEIGSFVLFGNWEQDADPQNGKEEIEWIVLDRSEGSLLLISKYVIDYASYAGVRTVSTWENCALRSWLNEEFFEAAFSADEQNRVITSEVSAEPNPRFGTEAGSKTEDKVFLLSIEEVEHYINENLLTGCEATAYTRQSGGFSEALYGDLMWWLRSPGLNENFVAYVKDDTEIHMDGYPETSYLGVRPVIRIEK